MAVQTIKATIQMRCGMEADLQPDKLVTGEWAVAKDTRKVWMCFRPGLVLRMATYEAFEQDMLEVQTILATCQDIQAAVERFMQLAQQHASQAEEWSVTSKSWAVGGTGTRQGENTNNSQYWSQQSQNHSNMSKSWAIGEGNLRPDEAVNSAKYFADQAGKIVDAAGSGGLIPMGTVTFENLPTSGMKKGWMYNISNDFTSDSRFEDGGGIKYNAGSNVYYTAVGKWDVLAGRQVSGVKGSVETSYRTGDVNITKANIGLENVPNVTTNNQTPTFTQASTRVNIASGEKLSVIFGKLMKWYADLKTVAFSGSYTDLSNKPTIPTNMTGATASAAGKAGLAPAPGAGKQNAYLRGDGTWVAPATTLAGTVPGIPLDQTMGPEILNRLNAVNSNLSRKIAEITPNKYVSKIFFRKNGNTVTILLEKSTSEITLMNETMVIGKVPEGFRPLAYVSTMLLLTLNAVPAYFAISSSGDISIRIRGNIKANIMLYATFTYVI